MSDDKKFDPARAHVLDALSTGEVVAVEENEDMYGHLTAAAGERVQPLLVGRQQVCAARRLGGPRARRQPPHEVRGETALAEMRRLLPPDGFALVVDWERGRERAAGPPDHLLYTGGEATSELAQYGFTVECVEVAMPFHFVLRANPTTTA